MAAVAFIHILAPNRPCQDTSYKDQNLTVDDCPSRGKEFEEVTMVHIAESKTRHNCTL
jgi:hypothetical protein